MGFELLLLSGLIFVFIISFCGLLQKIKQSYERERLIAERLRRRQEADSSSIEVYVNSSYIGDYDGGVFPTSPPPYSHVCPPPKYEEVMKSSLQPSPLDTAISIPPPNPRTNISSPPAPIHQTPPPVYTVS